MKRILFYLMIFSFAGIISCTEQVKQNLSLEDNDRLAQVEQAGVYLLDFQYEHRDAPIFSGSVTLSKTTQKMPLSDNSDFNYYSNMATDAIDGSEYECGPTELRDYIQSSVSEWTNQDFAVYSGWSGLLWDYAFLFQNETLKTDYYGSNGDFTNAINRTFNSLLKFWDIPTDIVIVSAHGNFWGDTSKIVDILEVYNAFGLFGYPGLTKAQIDGLAVNLSTAFSSEGFVDYTHPLLSFNAFAAPANGFWGTPNQIVMGDGIMDGYEDLGYGSVAPQAVLAHEYGHHVQFANGVPFYGTPESTRRTELMADALAAYYLTHKRGATMNWKRVEAFLQVFFDIGDCSFSSSNHHGTPNQRMRAAKYGYDVAKAEMVKGTISESEDFIDEFMNHLDDIIED